MSWAILYSWSCSYPQFYCCPNLCFRSSLMFFPFYFFLGLSINLPPWWINEISEHLIEKKSFLLQYLLDWLFLETKLSRFITKHGAWYNLILTYLLLNRSPLLPWVFSVPIVYSEQHQRVQNWRCRFSGGMRSRQTLPFLGTSTHNNNLKR